MRSIGRPSSLKTSIQIEEINDDSPPLRNSIRKGSDLDLQYSDIKSKYFSRLKLSAPKPGKSTPAAISRVSEIVIEPGAPTPMQTSVTQNFPRITPHSPPISIPSPRPGSKSAASSKKLTPRLGSASSLPLASGVLSPPHLDSYSMDGEFDTLLPQAHPFVKPDYDEVDAMLNAIANGHDVLPSVPAVASQMDSSPSFNYSPISNVSTLALVTSTPEHHHDSFDDPFEDESGGSYFEEPVVDQPTMRLDDYFRS